MRSIQPRATTARRAAEPSPVFARSSEASRDLLKVLRVDGGRLEAARRAFPAAPTPWIDLSTGVNPRAWRASTGDATRLPDPAATASLEAAAAASFGCRPEQVAAVAGADMALRLLPRLLSAATVAVLSPTYTGHREGWRAAGAAVREVAHADLAFLDADVVVVVNPNNPDGVLLTASQVRSLAARQRARNGWLIVDESFIDVAPDHSVAPAAGEGLIVLRSFGKFYGLPGLRLGFVVAGSEILSALRAVTGEWPVAAGAITSATAAYGDTAWQAASRARLGSDAARLDRLLIKHGFEILGGTPLFRLAAHADAERMFVGLARAGILVRPFADHKSWLRFGIPGPRAWKRLRLALEICV
ncbi:MAG: threonine-phosphate decarboxylase [Rhodospirillaceae bacterium]|nr:threonine-phosphate decarboxylase [Rhodospirillaceae bacterium]